MARGEKKVNAAAPSPLSPLGASAGPAGPALETAAFVLTEREARGQLVVRGDPGLARFADRVREELGLALPLQANTVTTNGNRSVLWMGPREWLAVMSLRRAEKLQPKLAHRLRKLHAAVVDVSHSRAVFDLRGARARDVLAKGCAIDLHPRAFGPGQCVQTRFARCHVLLHQTDVAPAYEIYVHRSFARYAWAWLEDAVLEYGGRSVTPGS